MPRLNRPISVRRSTAPVPARRRTDLERRGGWFFILAIAIGIGLLDWLTKAIIIATIPLGEMVVIVDHRIALWHVRNPAMILGLFGDLPLLYRQLLAGGLAVVGVTLLLEVTSRAHRLLPGRRPWAWLFVGLVLGGMFGNIGERVRHWGITDFLSFGWKGIWLPPGNVADLSIFLSIPIAFLVIAFEIEARAQRSRDVAPDADVAKSGPTSAPQAP